MKKLLSITMALVMMLTLLPVQSVVFADGKYTVHILESMEDSFDATVAYWGKETYSFESEKFADVAGLGKVLAIQADSSTNVGVDIKLPEGKAIENTEGTCVEIEFDFSMTNSEGEAVGSGQQMKIAPNGTNYMFFLTTGFRVENSTNSGSVTAGLTTKDMHRYKITLKSISNGTSNEWSLVSIMVDGVEKITDGTTYTSNQESVNKALSSFRFRTGGKVDGDTLYIDNISITSYNSDSEKENIPDRYSLYKKINAVSENALKAYDNGEITQSVLNGINEKINAALLVLQTKTSTKDDFDEKIASLDSVENVINAYNKIKETGAAYYIDEADAVILGDILTDSEISVNIPVYTSAGDTNTAFKLLGLIYEDNTDCATPQLVGVSKVQAQIEPDSIGNAEMTFDLSSYSDRSGLSVKVIVTDDYSDLTDSIAKAQAASKKDAPVGDGYSFVSDVNVSKVILNDEPQTQDFKMVYTLKGKAGSKVSLLVSKPVTDTEQESGAFEGISENPEAVIEYYNTAVFDENGKAVFEFVPQSGMGYYDYVINSEDYASPYSNKIFYASLSDIDTIIQKVYTDKTLDKLSTQEIDAASLGDPIVSEAKEAGVSVDNVLMETLSEKAYDARTLSEFTSSLFKKLNIVKLFRTSDSADTVMLLKDTYLSDVEALSQIESLSTSQKQQKAYTYMYKNNQSIINMSTLNSTIQAAVKDANKTTQNTGGSSGGGGGGGGGGSYASVVTPIVKEEQKPTIMQEVKSKFKDLDSVSWAEEAITEFAANGWVDGKADGVFAPSDKITREEFVKLVVNVFGFYDENAVCDFGDTDKNQWYYPYVASAASKGIVNGISDDYFGVGSTISRQDMAVIIYRIAMMNKLNLTEDGEYIPFADEIKISEYALEAVVELTRSGIINGADNNSFLPNGLATRAEAVKMVHGAYKLK